MILLNKIIAFFSNQDSLKKDTMKELSKDTSGNYLTEIIFPAYNFDAIAGDNYKSCDALLISNTALVFIEFKNQPANREDAVKKKEFKCDIKLKAVESLLALFKILKENNITNNFCDLCNVKKKLIVVYSSEKTKRNRRFKDRQVNNSEIKFDLEKYKGTYYHKVKTWSDEVFDSNFDKLF